MTTDENNNKDCNNNNPFLHVSETPAAVASSSCPASPKGGRSTSPFPPPVTFLKKKQTSSRNSNNNSSSSSSSCSANQQHQLGGPLPDNSCLFAESSQEGGADSGGGGGTKGGADLEILSSSRGECVSVVGPALYQPRGGLNQTTTDGSQQSAAAASSALAAANAGRVEIGRPHSVQPSAVQRALAMMSQVNSNNTHGANKGSAQTETAGFGGVSSATTTTTGNLKNDPDNRFCLFFGRGTANSNHNHNGEPASQGKQQQQGTRKMSFEPIAGAAPRDRDTCASLFGRPPTTTAVPNNNGNNSSFQHPQFFAAFRDVPGVEGTATAVPAAVNGNNCRPGGGGGSQDPQLLLHHIEEQLEAGGATSAPPQPLAYSIEKCLALRSAPASNLSFNNPKLSWLIKDGREPLSWVTTAGTTTTGIQPVATGNININNGGPHPRSNSNDLPLPGADHRYGLRGAPPNWDWKGQSSFAESGGQVQGLQPIEKEQQERRGSTTYSSGGTAAVFPARVSESEIIIANNNNRIWNGATENRRPDNIPGQLRAHEFDDEVIGGTGMAGEPDLWDTTMAKTIGDSRDCGIFSLGDIRQAEKMEVERRNFHRGIIINNNNAFGQQQLGATADPFVFHGDRDSAFHGDRDATTFHGDRDTANFHGDRDTAAAAAVAAAAAGGQGSKFLAMFGRTNNLSSDHPRRPSPPDSQMLFAQQQQQQLQQLQQQAQFRQQKQLQAEQQQQLLLAAASRLPLHIRAQLQQAALAQQQAQQAAVTPAANGLDYDLITDPRDSYRGQLASGGFQQSPHRSAAQPSPPRDAVQGPPRSQQSGLSSEASRDLVRKHLLQLLGVPLPSSDAPTSVPLDLAPPPVHPSFPATTTSKPLNPSAPNFCPSRLAPREGQPASQDQLPFALPADLGQQRLGPQSRASIDSSRFPVSNFAPPNASSAQQDNLRFPAQPAGRQFAEAQIKAGFPGGAAYPQSLPQGAPQPERLLDSSSSSSGAAAAAAQQQRQLQLVLMQKLLAAAQQQQLLSQQQQQQKQQQSDMSARAGSSMMSQHAETASKHPPPPSSAKTASGLSREQLTALIDYVQETSNRGIGNGANSAARTHALSSLYHFIQRQQQQQQVQNPASPTAQVSQAYYRDNGEFSSAGGSNEQQQQTRINSQIAFQEGRGNTASNRSPVNHPTIQSHTGPPPPPPPQRVVAPPNVATTTTGATDRYHPNNSASVANVPPSLSQDALRLWAALRHEQATAGGGQSADAAVLTEKLVSLLNQSQSSTNRQQINGALLAAAVARLRERQISLGDEQGAGYGRQQQETRPSPPAQQPGVVVGSQQQQMQQMDLANASSLRALMKQRQLGGGQPQSPPMPAAHGDVDLSRNFEKVVESIGESRSAVQQQQPSGELRTAILQRMQQARDNVEGKPPSSGGSPGLLAQTTVEPDSAGGGAFASSNVGSDPSTEAASSRQEGQEQQSQSQSQERVETETVTARGFVDEIDMDDIVVEEGIESHS